MNTRPAYRAYELRTYDVWGNEDEGYEVNNTFAAGRIYLPESFTDEELFSAIGAETTGENAVEVDGGISDDEHIYVIRERDAYPVCEVTRDEDYDFTPIFVSGAAYVVCDVCAIKDRFDLRAHDHAYGSNEDEAARIHCDCTHPKHGPSA